MYVSAAQTGLDNDALSQILASSRRNNAPDGITGMLIHIDGGFMQILEGEEDAVRRTYARIGRDTRHDSVRTLFDRPVTKRLFPDWTVGFDRPMPGDHESAGIFEATRSAVEGAVGQDRALEVAILLRTFYLVNTNRHAA